MTIEIIVDGEPRGTFATSEVTEIRVVHEHGRRIWKCTADGSWEITPSYQEVPIQWESE